MEATFGDGANSAVGVAYTVKYLYLTTVALQPLEVVPISVTSNCPGVVSVKVGVGEVDARDRAFDIREVRIEGADRSERGRDLVARV